MPIAISFDLVAVLDIADDFPQVLFQIVAGVHRQGGIVDRARRRR